jgi:hypothetical protein
MYARWLKGRIRHAEIITSRLVQFPSAPIPIPFLKSQRQQLRAIRAKVSSRPNHIWSVNPLVCTDHASRRCKHFTPVSNQPSEPAGIMFIINDFQIPIPTKERDALAHPDTLHATHPLVDLVLACCYSYIHPSIHTYYCTLLRCTPRVTVQLLRYDTTDHWDLEHTPFLPMRMHIPFLAPRTSAPCWLTDFISSVLLEHGTRRR